ncbi:MAG TPA: type II secretion system protein, partial [Acidimicrobiales bacterium]|nr:type II secretion system protein [Acidimicrobiales bacterium]
MSWKRQFQERASESAESNPDERGDTLIEVLLAIVILGIAGVALLTAFATAITASSQHRQIASLDASVRAASDQVIAQVQQAGNNAFGPANCTNNPLGTSYKPTWNLTGTFTVTSYVVTYWNGSSFVPPASLTNCKGYEPQLWTITIGSGSTSTTVSTVIYDPQAPPVIGGSTPFQLVFLTPT